MNAARRVLASLALLLAAGVAHAQPVPGGVVPTAATCNGVPVPAWVTSGRPSSPAIGAVGLNIQAGYCETFGTGGWSPSAVGGGSPALGAMVNVIAPESSIGRATGAGTQASPYVSADGTAGFNAAVSALTFGGQIPLSGAQYNLTAGVTISTPGVAIQGTSMGGNVDPNGESQGYFGSKIHLGDATHTGLTALTFGGANALQGLIVQRLYVWGTSNSDGSAGIVANGTGRLDQMRISDVAMGNVNYGLEALSWMDAPYIERFSCLGCGIGIYVPASNTQGMPGAQILDNQQSDNPLGGICDNSTAGGIHIIGGVDWRDAFLNPGGTCPKPAIIYLNGFASTVNGASIHNAGYNQLTLTQTMGADGIYLAGTFALLSGNDFVNNGGPMATFTGYIASNTTLTASTGTPTLVAGDRITCVGCTKGIYVASGTGPWVVNCPSGVCNVASSGSPVAMTAGRGYDIDVGGNYNTIEPSNMYYDTSNAGGLVLQPGVNGNVFTSFVPVEMHDMSGGQQNYLFYADNDTGALRIRGYYGFGLYGFPAVSIEAYGGETYGVGLNIDASRLSGGRVYNISATDAAAGPADSLVVQDCTGGACANVISFDSSRNTHIYGYASITQALQTGTTALTLNAGDIGMATDGIAVAAPGAAGGKLVAKCGTSGTLSLLWFAGTSTTGVTVAANAGGGVTGC